MNTNAMVVSALRKQRESLIAKLTGIDAALAVFGGGKATTNAIPGSQKGRRRRKQVVDPVTGLTPIQKAQAALKAKRAATAAAKAGAPVNAGASLAAAV